MFIKAFEFNSLDVEAVIEFLKKAQETGFQIIALDITKGENHIISSVDQALKAFRSGKGIAHYEAMEVLLTITAEKQITKAVVKGTPKKRSVFICWDKNCEKIWKEFQESFDIKEITMPEYSEKEVKEAIERSATFSYL
jgi:tRNA threonylcarbamoyladenosine modification (KEOPS) complex Cgi121 subunit